MPDNKHLNPDIISRRDMLKNTSGLLGLFAAPDRIINTTMEQTIANGKIDTIAPMRAKMSGKKALLEQLIAQGVTYIFGNPGSTEEAFMDELVNYPQLKYILALHEGVAVGMADGYAQLTHKPAVVQLHSAPGLGNAMNMLYNAKVTNVPLVVISGHNHSKVLFQEPNLSGPLVEMAKPVTKWATQVSHVQDIPQALRRAFKIAAEPPRGPVYLAFTLDAFEEEAEMEIIAGTYTSTKVRPDESIITAAAGVLANAHSPAIFMGDGIGWSDAQAEVTKLAEALGAPMFELTGNSQVNAPATHPLKMPSIFYVFPKDIKAALQNCDVLLMVGARQFPITFPEPDKEMDASLLPLDCKVIQMNADVWELGKNINPMFSIATDPKAGLSELTQELKKIQSSGQQQAAESRRRTIGEKKSKVREQFKRDVQRDWNNLPISPVRLLEELRLVAPANALYFTEGLSNEKLIEATMQPEAPSNMLRGTGGPGLGIGLPGAIGAQLAMPESNVIGIVSDGASMFSISALWTAANKNIPVTYIILNNGAYQVLKLSTVEFYGKEKMKGRPFIGMDLQPPSINFAQIAEGMGVKSWRIDHPDKLKEVLKAAIFHQGPSLVEVIIEARLE